MAHRDGALRDVNPVDQTSVALRITREAESSQTGLVWKRGFHSWVDLMIFQMLVLVFSCQASTREQRLLLCITSYCCLPDSPAEEHSAKSPRHCVCWSSRAVNLFIVLFVCSPHWARQRHCCILLFLILRIWDNAWNQWVTPQWMCVGCMSWRKDFIPSFVPS